MNSEKPLFRREGDFRAINVNFDCQWPQILGVSEFVKKVQKAFGRIPRARDEIRMIKVRTNGVYV